MRQEIRLDPKNTLVILLIAVLLAVVVYFLVQPTQYLVGAFVIDDGLYYLEVPRNIVSGNGVTYDNRTITNGFHPLWGGVGVLLALVAGTESSDLLRAAMIVQALFVMLSLVCLWKIARETKLELLGTVLAMAALFFSRLDLWLSTMESATLLLCLLLLILLSLRLDLLRSERIKDNVLLGALLALVFLSRLDTIFIVISFLIVQALLRIRAKFALTRLRPAIVSGAVFSALTVPYLIVNKIYFDSIVPVSGLRKMSDTSLFLQNVAAASSNMLHVVANKTNVPVFALVSLIVGGAFVFAWSCLHPKVKPSLGDVLKGGVIPAFVLGVISRSVYLLAYVGEYTKVPWYWVPEYVIAYLLAGFFISVLIRFLSWYWLRNAIVLYATTVAMVLVGCRYLILDANKYQEANSIVYNSATWAANNVAKGKLFAMTDSGVFAFFSNHDVVPMNGLITDRPTMEMIRREGFSNTMRHFEVDYFVNYVRDVVPLPEHIVLYESPVIPNSTYKDHRVAIMNFRDFPDETIKYGLRMNQEVGE
jgi:hypothetical protein